MAWRPLVAMTGAFCAGVLLTAQAPAWMLPALLFLLLPFGLLALTQRGLYVGIALLTCFVLLGAIRARSALLRDPDDVSRLAPALLTLTGVIASDVEWDTSADSHTAPAVRFTLAVRQAARNPNETPANVSGRIAVRAVFASASEALSPTEIAHRAPRYGDTIRLRGRLEIPDISRNPGAFDYRAYLARNGIYTTLRVRSREDWQILGEHGVSGNPAQRLAYALREAVIRHTAAALPPERAALLNGILLGARNDLPGSVNDQFQRTGTSHLLAASGMNAALVVVLALALLRRLGLRYRPAYAGALVAVWLFALMADLSPSILRATLMATVYIGGILLQREPDFLNAVSLSALLPLLFHPLDLFDIGFQLSYAAVLSIALLLPFTKGITTSLRNRMKGDWPGAKLLCAMANGLVLCFLLTLCAQIGTAPLTAYYFNTVSLVGLVVNGLLVPWIGGIIALGFTAAALGAIHPFLSAPLDFLLNGCMMCFLAVVAWGSRLPFASIAVPSPPVWGLVLYYALILLLAIILNRRKQENLIEAEEEPDL